MESYSICEWLWDKMKRPLHLYDTFGLCIVHGFESGLVGLEGGGGDLLDLAIREFRGQFYFRISAKRRIEDLMFPSMSFM